MERLIRLLHQYEFRLEDKPKTLNPDILGLVFEKTVNYLTGTGTNRRKSLGAYYTPDDVTSFICKQTIRYKIFEVIQDCLRRIGWKEYDISHYKSLEDFLEYPPRNPKIVKEIYEQIQGITVLDPACGSGHFLTSALKELLRIHKNLKSIFDSSLNNYEIKKNIITGCLFGVDIERSAVEIARLRLWLSLIEDLNISNMENEIETLPNIEYNVEEGNSLIGFTSQPDYLQMGIDDKTLSVKEIFSKIDRLKQEFRLSPDPGEAKKINEVIDENIGIYNGVLNKKLSALLSTEYKTRCSIETLSAANPFHWRLKFSDVFSKSEGFDIIIGNPPYLESNKLNYPTSMFVTKDRGSTYAHFFEMALKILNIGGFVGFIVPVATVCTERMIPLHEIFMTSFSRIHISNFDDRPGKIFHGLEHCRSSIIICKKKETTEEKTKVYSTKYNRWYTSERNKLFSNLEFVECSNVITPGIIPKVGKELEINILLKLREQPILSRYLMNKNSNTIVWYYRPVQYWIKAVNFLPIFAGVRNISSDLKEIYVNNNMTRDQIVAILNSNLFYWYFIISSDCRHLNVREINNFNIDFDNLDSSYSNL